MGTDPPPPLPAAAAAAAAADIHHDPMAAVPVGGGGDPAATALLALGEDDEAPPPAPAAGETPTGEPHDAEGEREPKRARLAGTSSEHPTTNANNHVDPHAADAEMASAAAAAAEALADVHHNPHDEHHHHHHHPTQQHGSHAHAGGYDPAAAAHYHQHQQQAYAAHYAHHPQHHYDYTASAYAQHQHQHEAYHHHHAEAGQYQQQQGRGQGRDGYVPGGGEATGAARGASAKDSEANAGTTNADAATAAAIAAAAAPARRSQSQIQATTATATAAANNATRDAKWNAMYDLLCQYRASKGDCLVPGRHPKLGPWVQVQRAQYRLYRENKPSTLSQDKVDRLHALDFAWQIARNRDEAWNDMYAQLVAYAQAHGGRTNVPSHSKDQPKLGSWCKRQRKTYRDLRDGKSTTMKPEWVDRLREIGFDLDGPAAAAGGGGAEAAGAAVAGAAAAPANGDDDSGDEGEGGGASKPAAAKKATEDDATFTLRLEELKQFVAAEGHGAIPENYPANEVLGRWATQKRKQKRKLDAGKPTRLTAERVQKLEEAGFAWKIWGNRSEKWDEMYQKLVQYKAEYGTVYVVNSARTADPDHRKLGMWCDRQKAAYKLRQQGKNSPMTEERIQRLEEIG